MAPETDNRTQLIRELRHARERFDDGMRGVRRDLNVPARAARSFQRRMPLWLGGALVSGWLISRLPARKRKIKIYVDKDEREVKRVAKVGFFLGLLKLLFSAAKPAIMAYATKRISDLATSQKKVERKVERVERKVD